MQNFSNGRPPEMRAPRRPAETREERIRRLNDEFRMSGPAQTDHGHWIFTQGVAGFGEAGIREAVRLVVGFTAFTPDNDPYGTHDFGAFGLMHERLFWKIDYYSRDLQSGSPDEADPSLTRRVLTIMLASEY